MECSSVISNHTSSKCIGNIIVGGQGSAGFWMISLFFILLIAITFAITVNKPRSKRKNE